MTTIETIRCQLCGVPIASVDEAIVRGWVPDYYYGVDVQEGPVCPECVRDRLRVADDGELEIIIR